MTRRFNLLWMSNKLIGGNSEAVYIGDHILFSAILHEKLAR